MYNNTVADTEYRSAAITRSEKHRVSRYTPIQSRVQSTAVLPGRVCEVAVIVAYRGVCPWSWC